MVEPSSSHPTIPPARAEAFRNAVWRYSDWRAEPEPEVKTATSVARPRQRLAELAFEHKFEEFANPIAQPSFDRVEPVVEKMESGYAVCQSSPLRRRRAFISAIIDYSRKGVRARSSRSCNAAEQSGFAISESRQSRSEERPYEKISMTHSNAGIFAPRSRSLKALLMQRLLKLAMAAGFGLALPVTTPAIVLAQQLDQATELEKKATDLFNQGEYSDAIPIVQRQAVLKDAKTEDEDFMLHPERIVTATMSFSEVRAWQDRLRAIDEFHGNFRPSGRVRCEG